MIDPTNEPQVRIRLARLDDINGMREIERAAGRLFAGIGMEDVASHEPPDAAALVTYVQNRRAWVADVNARPVGYAIVDVVDGCGHLEQVSVHPDYGRRGLGRALVGAAIEWTRSAGLPAVTLSTFRCVPWNGPYYASLGFRPLSDAELTPGLLALQAHEAKLGLATSIRHCMRLDLPVRDGTKRV